MTQYPIPAEATERKLPAHLAIRLSRMSPAFLRMKYSAKDEHHKGRANMEYSKKPIERIPP